MNNFQIISAFVPVSTDSPVDAALHQAIAARLARYTGQTRSHTESELRAFLNWCVDRVRRPHVPPESLTLGLSHLQFEEMLQAARVSVTINDFALVTVLGLGLRLFEACGADVRELREEHGHRVPEVRGKGGEAVLTPLPPAVQRAIERAVDRRG